MYEDAGDGYGYERGNYSMVELAWNDGRKELVISERKGSFEGMVKLREFQLVFVSDKGRETRTVRYAGGEIKVSLEH